MKKLVILIFLTVTFRIVSFGNTSEDTAFKTRYVRCILTNQILEEELIKRDNLLTKAEEFNKDVTDSLTWQRITNLKLQDTIKRENHRKKQWRKAAFYEGVAILSAIIISTITIK